MKTIVLEGILRTDMTVERDDKEIPTWGPRERWRILKNVLVVSLAFMVQFTAFNGAENLQSSINAEAGLGTASLAAMYVAVTLSSLSLPVLIIKWLGSKWTMPFCYLAYMPYILAQLHPTYYTLVPAGVLAGLASAPLWCSMCTYIAVLADAQSKISDVPKDALLARFLGQFFMVFHINQVWGNLISSLVISTKDNKAALTTVDPVMIPELCGANFLPSSDAEKALLNQPQEKIQMLVGIYLALMMVAIMVVTFGLDSPVRYKTLSSETEKTGWNLLIAIIKLTMERNQLLLIVISIFIGLQQGFVAADMTVAFVSCAIGPGSVGYMMLVHGLSDAFGCAITGYLVRMMGRVRLICFAICLNIALYVTMLMWKPQPDIIYVHYIIAIVAGLCNSIWLVQINAYYGILFPGREEPSFANFRLFESIGFVITFAISPYLRTRSKIYILCSAMIIGSIGYFIVEYRQRKRNKTLTISQEKDFDGRDNKGYQL